MENSGPGFGIGKMDQYCIYIYDTGWEKLAKQRPRISAVHKKTSYGSDLRHPFRSHWPGGQSAEQSLAWTSGSTEPAPRIPSPLFLLLIIRLSFSLWPCHRGMWLYTIIICQSIFTVQWTADIKIYDKLILTNLCYLNVIFQPLVCTALLLLASVGF